MIPSTVNEIPVRSKSVSPASRRRAARRGTAPPPPPAAPPSPPPPSQRCAAAPAAAAPAGCTGCASPAPPNTHRHRHTPGRNPCMPFTLIEPPWFCRCGRRPVPTSTLDRLGR
eukprot:3280170-Pyramimonas_sp.AAC.1